MKKNYSMLKEKVMEMNNLNDEFSLIKCNNDDGPKFSSVKEMKDFIEKVENDDFNYFFEDGSENIKDSDFKDIFVESFKHTKDNIFFFIFTFKKIISILHIYFLKI